MEPTINVVILWALFAGTHVGLSTKAPRAALIARIGEWGFIGVFSLVAALTYGLLIHYFALHRFDGAAGLALSEVRALRWLLYGISAAGTGLLAMSLFDYPTSAYALEARRGRYEPRGVARISRHGFFSGLFLLAAAHALLATHLVATVFFACTALFTWLGATHQDARLAAGRGETHRDFVAATSFLPFAAILNGRQRLALEEIPVQAWLAGLAMIWLLRSVHESIFAAGGAYAIGVTLLGAAIASLQAWRAQRRRAGASAIRL